MPPAPGPQWFPRSVGYAFGEPVVELVRLDRPPPPFLSDLELAAAAEERRLPLADVELPAADEDSGPDGLVFHMPRSGSSLFARMLTVPADHVCLVEVSAINALLSHSSAPGTVDPAWLRRLLQLYRIGLGRPAARLFVKTSSWMVLQLPLFREAFPATPACFVYRDPVEVMVQVMQRRPGWLVAGAPALPGYGPGPHGGADDARYCAAVLAGMCRSVTDADPPLALVPHAQLAESGERTMADWFDVHLDARARERLARLYRLDADDWSGQRAYVPDGAALRRRADPQIDALARTVVQPWLRRMAERVN